MDRMTAFTPQNGVTPERAELTNQVVSVTKKDVDEALRTLSKYKQGKSNLEKRIVENEQWYKTRHWDVMRNKYSQGDKTTQPRPEPTSAWLFNSIANKHADMMDNIPAPIILPRERGDERDADSLSKIIPVILERNSFEQTYSDEQWYKLKHGTCAYSITWDGTVDNGLGDIDISKTDLLNLFWEPGCNDIQESRNLFCVSLVDEDIAQQNWPQLKDKKGQTIDITKYVYDDDVDTSEKTMVVDWYYKKKVGTKTVLHLVKIIGDEMVFASENEPENYPEGWYAHGLYPFVFDTLYPEEGSPVGFGYVDVMKSPQMFIDKIDQLVLENTLRTAKTRYFAKKDAFERIEDFADLSQEIITVNTNDMQNAVKKVDQAELNMGILKYVQYKVDELKETSGNRDVNTGGSTSGVTAASAISALQEAGNKLSRDLINSSYRAYARIINMCIELIRQFYDIQRSFRIEGQTAVLKYITYSNAGIVGYPQMMPDGSLGKRKPIFDIKVSAQVKSPFSTLSQNELAKELYQLGVFNPQLADQALMMLDIMEFEGKEELVQKVQERQQMYLAQQQLAMHQALLGQPMPQDVAARGATDLSRSSIIPAENGVAGAIRNANTPYAERLRRNARARVKG